MGRPKGGKNNYHSKEEKIKIVKEMLDSNLSPLDIERKYNISHSLAGKWRKDYFSLTDLKNRIILEINSFVIELTGRRPIIIPMILISNEK